MSLIIAEIGTAHEGDINKAKELIDLAASSGADAIKFQWVYADEILHPNTGYVNLPSGKIPLYERFKQLECNKDFYLECKDYVHSKGALFCCSPFGIKSLQELLSINPDIVKIASPELNYYQLLKYLSDYRKGKEEQVKVILSSGVSLLSDIEKAIKIIGTNNVSLLHCITSYPAPEEEYNLKLITNLQNIFGIECGVSDHSLDPILVPSLSIACGGTVVEKHITLSRKTSGLDDKVALEGEQFAMMSHVIHQSQAGIRHYGKEEGSKRIIEQLSSQYGKEKIQKILGDGIKKLAPSEKENYTRTNRSIHVMSNIKKGHILTKEDIKILRTEKELSVGLSPEFYDLVLGKTCQKDLKSGDGLDWEDLM